MIFDKNNSNTGGKCLCDSCLHAQEYKVKSKKVEMFIYCRKWQATVENVGVCKYYEDIEDYNLPKND